VPAGSRASQGGSLTADQLSEQNLARIRGLNDIAAGRGQSLAQMALSWVLRDRRVTSVLVGASSVAQLEENLSAAAQPGFSQSELAAIDQYAVEGGIDIWASSSAVSSAPESAEP
jgi:L-glyceraldehyde 3-phosphate reductase